MTDEVQTTASAADPAAAPPADAVTSKAADEQAAIRALIEGNVAPAPKPEPTAEEQAAAQAEKDKAEGKLPDWAAERVARAKKQRDESREREAQIEARFGELREVGDALTTKLDPDQYPTHEAYLAAKTEILDRAAKLRGEPAVPPKSAVNEAAEELAYEVQRADPELWDEVRAGEEVDGKWKPKHLGITAAMVEALADEDDSVGKLRALIAMPADERIELAQMSDRQQRKAIRRLEVVAGKAKAAPVAAAVEAKPAAPARDPETGQFTRRVSSAPPPIDPLGGGGAADKPLAKMSYAEFEAKRNAEERRTDAFGW